MLAPFLFLRSAIHPRQDIYINVIRNSINLHLLHKRKILLGMLLVSVSQQYFGHSQVSVVFQLYVVDQHIHINTTDMPFTREHQIRNPSSDDANIIPVLIEQIYQFHKHPMGCFFLPFTIIKAAS